MNLVGSEALTFFCGIKSEEAVSRLVAESLRLELAPDWDSVTAVVEGHGVRVSRRVFSPDSEFSRVILGMHAAIRRARELLPGSRAEALAFLGECDLMLGVTLDPAIVDNDERERLAASWAADLNALVFDGRWLMDSKLNRTIELDPAL